MPISNLNQKIIENVRNKIVISNLEREEMMKISKRKQFISACAILLIILSGGFWTVNAATEGKLMEDIKEKYEEYIVIKLNDDNCQVTTEKNEQGEEIVTYTIHPNDEQETIIEVNKNAMQEEFIQSVMEEGEDGSTNITFYDYQP